MEGRKRTALVLILGLLSAIGPFSIDMYLPGFPAIATALNTREEYVAYSLSSYFVGVCVGQLLTGPLLDRYGRKAPLYVGLGLYILASVGCALASTVEVLIAFRFLQAVGGCTGMVAPRAVVRDLFPVEENAKIFSLLVLVLGVSPIIAPTLGSYVIGAYGWEWVFTFLAVLGLMILVTVYFFLPESRPPDPGFSLRPRSILASFGRVAREPQFYTYALTGAIISAAMFAYISGSPTVFMGTYGVSQQHYGWIFAFNAVGLIASSQLNNLLLRRYRSEQIIRVTLPLQAALGLFLVAGSLLGVLGLYGTIGGLFLYLSCQGFSFPNATALAMAPFTREAGSASALMGALQMALAAATSALVGLLGDGTAVPMTAVMTVCVLTGLLILTIGRKKIRYRAKEEEVSEEAFELVERL